MKSILFIAFLALATIGCDTPEKSTGSDTTAPPMSDTAATQPGMASDTAATMPVDTTTSTPNPSDTTRVQ
jgi:PBP1b-binding outer membrane lipoprotein LpoB